MFKRVSTPVNSKSSLFQPCVIDDDEVGLPALSFIEDDGDVDDALVGEVPLDPVAHGEDGGDDEGQLKPSSFSFSTETDAFPSKPTSMVVEQSISGCLALHNQDKLHSSPRCSPPCSYLRTRDCASTVNFGEKSVESEGRRKRNFARY